MEIKEAMFHQCAICESFFHESEGYFHDDGLFYCNRLYCEPPRKGGLTIASMIRLDNAARIAQERLESAIKRFRQVRQEDLEKGQKL